MNQQMTKRWVIKLGSRLLVPEDQLDLTFVVGLATQIAALKKSGYEIVVVTSGAIATGLKLLQLQERPKSIAKKQAVAAVGQIALMGAYRQVFEKSGLEVGQILLTHEDFRNRQRFLNARHTLQALIEMGVVPLINENDSIASEEIKVGDNDNLAGMVACLWEADLLLLLTDIDGLFTADPKSDLNAKLIPVVEKIDANIEAFAVTTSNPTAVGGMRTKIEAAKRAASYGVPTVIANGRESKIIERLVSGERIGTLIQPPTGERIGARKHWIRFVLKPQGKVYVDAGAFGALSRDNKSLLPSGIIKIEGTFGIGEVVELVSSEEKTFACGLSSYSSQELERIKGCQSNEIEELLGYRYSSEVIHKDDLVIF